MALLLGVPIPFGSVGQLSRKLWQLSGQPEAATTFRAALSINAWQARPGQMQRTMLCQLATRSLDAEWSKKLIGNKSKPSPCSCCLGRAG